MIVTFRIKCYSRCMRWTWKINLDTYSIYSEEINFLLITKYSKMFVGNIPCVFFYIKADFSLCKANIEYRLLLTYKVESISGW